jgi:uncharacterized protein (TIGR00645 family)
MHTRWLLAPYYLGLTALLVLYFVNFVVETIKTAGEILTGSESSLISVLHVLEHVMIANLIVMIMLGGFSLFVKPFTGISHQLSWLDQIGATQLKVKFGLSLVSVSSIYLLEALVEPKPEKVLVKSIVIHVTFLVSTLIIASVDRLMHSAQSHQQTIGEQEKDQ